MRQFVTLYRPIYTQVVNFTFPPIDTELVGSTQKMNTEVFIDAIFYHKPCKHKYDSI